MDKFVFRVPKWQGELLFTKELLVFAGVITLMLAGLLFCFWGYKYFKTALLLGVGAVTCYVSFLLAEPVTGNPVIRMFLTVSLTFLSICIVYLLGIGWGYFLDKLQLRDAFGKNSYLFAAPLGALIIGLTSYRFIWRGLTEAAVAALVFCVCGLLFQRFRRAKAVRFKRYHDLLLLSRPETDAGESGYMATEPTVASEAEPKLTVEAVAAEAEPEPTAEAVAAEAEPEPTAAVGTEAEQEPAHTEELMAAYMPDSESEPETAEAEPTAEVVVAETEPEAEPEPTAAEAAEEPQPAYALQTRSGITELEQDAAENMELSDTVKALISGRPEPQEDILEDALFVRRMKESAAAGRQMKQRDTGLAAGRDAEAVTTARREADMAAGRRRKAHKKQNSTLARGAAVALAGIGLFIAGRASKGGD